MAVSKEARLKFWLCATGLCGRSSVECIRCTLSQQVTSRSLLLCPPAFTTAGGAKRGPDRNRKRVKGCSDSRKLAEQPPVQLSLSWCIFEAPCSVASFSLSLLSFSYCCPSVCLDGYTSVYLFLWWWPLCFVLWGSCCGGQIGHASRRAMLQQLHGVTMYSHDEHHSTTSYCWSDRGKRASATNASPAVLLTTLRPSVRMSVRPVDLYHLKHT